VFQLLIRFSVQNYLSFKIGVTFNMTCAPITEHEDTHTFQEGSFHLVKSSAIFGANASGKSNLIFAILFMKRFILGSSRESNVLEDIEVVPFRLSTETDGQPSIFEIEFLQNGQKYRYGFKVDRKYVYEEWLYGLSYNENKKKEILFFSRKNDSIELPKDTIYYKEGKGLEEKTRKNALFLSVVANFNGEISLEIMKWLEKLNVYSGMNKYNTTINPDYINDLSYKKRVLNLLRAADMGIEDLFLSSPSALNTEVIEDKNVNNKTKQVVSQSLFSKRNKYDANENVITQEAFDVSEEESEGTKKFIGLVNRIIDKIDNGGVIIIDEFDAKLHPLLTLKIIELFNSYDINHSNAQLIIATHDATKLNKKYFRRDQIWFAEKDSLGSTSLFSLFEYHEDGEKVRKDASYEKDYLLGKYGAIPSFNSWSKALEDTH
jgi:AAA15 family ATPase/GTPase